MSNKRSHALVPENRANQGIVRLPTGRFAPGASGNAGGSPKAVRDVAAAARERMPEAISVLAKVMRDRDAPAAVGVTAVTVTFALRWRKATAQLAQTILSESISR